MNIHLCMNAQRTFISWYLVLRFRSTVHKRVAHGAFSIKIKKSKNEKAERGKCSHNIYNRMGCGI